MKQFMDTRYKWAHEGEHFVLSDIDRNFYACHYLDSNEGFVIDKQVFDNHLSKGKIQSSLDTSIAV